MARPEKKSESYDSIFAMILLLVIPACLFLHTAASSKTLSGELSVLRVEGEFIFLESRDLQKLRVEKFVKACPKPSEIQKIQYLLRAVRGSKLHFFRNGTEYSGQQAGEWLTWKWHHKQFNNKPVVTAKDFIERVATHSNRTGEPYQLILDKKTKVPLALVFSNELNSLESALLEQQKSTSLPLSVPQMLSNPTEAKSLPPAMEPASASAASAVTAAS